MFDKIGFRGRLIVLVVVALAGMISLSVIDVLHLRGQMMEDRKAVLRSAVQLATSTAADLHERARKGEFTQEEAQARAAKVIQGMRFLDGEYFYIYDSKALGIMHPIRPEYVGVSHWDRKDKAGEYVIRVLIEAALSGNGFRDTYTARPGGTDQVPKLHYIEHFKPWDWVIGTGLYMDDLNERFQAELLRAAIGVGVAILLVGLAALTITRAIFRQIGGEPRLAMHLMERASAGDLTMHVGDVPPGSLAWWPGSATMRTRSIPARRTSPWRSTRWRARRAPSPTRPRRWPRRWRR